MKKNFPSIALFGLLHFFFSCSTVKNTVPSSIGLQTLENYEYAPGSPVTDTLYKVFQNEGNFNSSFRPIAGATVKRPGFTGQTVVVIVLKDGSSPMRFERAQVVGREIQVFVQTCPKPDCDNMPTPILCLATVPRVGSAERVQFFVNGQAKGSVTL